ncbi:MAG: hypothetical protein JNN15_17770, partial [Blastocatellia bacterium]|nr:hypothetical protein [Blastocatellia bacterium]
EYFLPAGYVFTIWGVNYFGLLALGIWQALPKQSSNPRVRSSAVWLAVTSLCNPIWILLASYQTFVPWTVPVLIAMEVSAWIAYIQLEINRNNAISRTERFLQIPLQIYVGWLSVATIANTEAALNILKWNLFGIDPITWAITMLLVSTIAAYVIGKLANNDNIYRAVFVWAYIGIVVEQYNTPSVALTAGVMALLVLVMIFTSTNSNQLEILHKTLS